MTVAVTGAAGHVGGNLVRALLARGRPVRAIVRTDRRSLEGLDVEIVEADVRDLPSLRRALAGAEVVYHTAARISLSLHEGPLLRSINVLGTGNVVDACLHCGVRRLVHFSSIHAFRQQPLDEPIDEARPLVDPAGGTSYSSSKAAGELEVQKGLERGLDAIILNPTAIIGPFDHRPSHFGQAMLAFAHGRIPALVSGGYDWVDVRDVVEAALQAEIVAPVGERYVLSGEWTTVADLAEKIATLTGVRPPLWVCPMPLAYVGAPLVSLWSGLTGERPIFTLVSLEALRGANSLVSHQHASQDLGYQPRPLTQTLVDTLRWFADHGYMAPRILSCLQEAL